MADKNKTAANVVLEVALGRYNKDKHSVSVRSKGTVIKKELIDNTSLSDLTKTISEMADDLADTNEVKVNEIPIVIDGNYEGFNEVLKERGYNVARKSKAKKDKNYYGYSDDYYDYYYEPLTPYGVINFNDLEEAQAAEDLNNDYLVLFAQYAEMGKRIIDGSYMLEFGDERGKLSLMTELTQQFLTKLESVTAQREGSYRKERKQVNLNPANEGEALETLQSILVNAVEDATEEPIAEDVTKEQKPELVVKSKGVVLFKGANGDLIWAGIHTNKFQDRDRDILKEKSHTRFVEKVESGEYPYPELWIWHIEKAVGETTWLAYDQRGFLLSGGRVFPEYEELVTTLVKNTPEMGMSHGMPYESVVYDAEGYIDEYQSKEVTMLPVDEASNILTSFTVEKV